MCREILLRPHHGMCLAYFVGKGYSSGFAKHMAEVKKQLEEGSRIKLTAGADEICSACPNLADGVCTDADKVEGFDRSVLGLCCLKEGDALLFTDFSALVRSRILDCGRRREICGGCKWEELCR